MPYASSFSRRFGRNGGVAAWGSRGACGAQGAVRGSAGAERAGAGTRADRGVLRGGVGAGRKAAQRLAPPSARSCGAAGEPASHPWWATSDPARCGGHRPPLLEGRPAERKIAGFVPEPRWRRESRSPARRAGRPERLGGSRVPRSGANPRPRLAPPTGPLDPTARAPRPPGSVPAPTPRPPGRCLEPQRPPPTPPAPPKNSPRACALPPPAHAKLPPTGRPTPLGPRR